MARKRSDPNVNHRVSKPKKVARKKTTSPGNNAHPSPNARIAELEDQIKDLHAFIDANGLTRKAPLSIRQHMLKGPSAAKALADQIKDAAEKVSSRLSAQTLNAKKTGISSDDMSEAMMPFLQEAKELRNLPNSTAVAFDLVVRLGRYSYGALDGKGSGYGERPSDEVVDELLVELATERKKIEPSWDFRKVLDTLQQQAEHLKRYGIGNFCARTIKLLSAW